MSGKFKSIGERKKSETYTSFCKRFSIEIDLETEKINFINRELNLVEYYFPELETHYSRRSEKYNQVLKLIATELGIRYERNQYFRNYNLSDFKKLLWSLEALYKVIDQFEPGTQIVVDKLVREGLSKSDVDLGVTWKDGVFTKSGAKILDEKLVDEPYYWLSDPVYTNVLTPFKKGVSDFLKATNNPERLKDVVRDMYVALEKMARIVCNNNNNLGANTEQLIKILQLSTHYEDMLRKHTEYAHEFRHAIKGESKQKLPQPQEVEAFIYTTGLFIRLAIQCLNTK